MIPNTNKSSPVSQDQEMGPMDDTNSTPRYPVSSTAVDEHGEKAIEPMAGHTISVQDPDNPQNWPMHRKVYISAVSVAFAFVV
jgi:nitroreductase